MNKKILLGALLAINFTTYSFMLQENNLAELSSDLILEKGRQYMRKGEVSSFIQRTGVTNSTQYLELVGGNGAFQGSENYSEYDSSSFGVVMGTTSSFGEKERSGWITGVSAGYIVAKANYEKSYSDKMKTLGINAFLGYEKNSYFLMGYLSGSISDDTKYVGERNKNTIGTGLEFGKYFKIFEKAATIPLVGVFFDRAYIYPYVGIDYYRYFFEDAKFYNVNLGEEAYGGPRANFGASYYLDYTRFYVKLDARWNQNLFDQNNSVAAVNTDTLEISEVDAFVFNDDAFTMGVSTGYYVAEDLLLSLEITGLYTQLYNDTVYSVRVGYTF